MFGDGRGYVQTIAYTIIQSYCMCLYAAYDMCIIQAMMIFRKAKLREQRSQWTSHEVREVFVAAQQGGSSPERGGRGDYRLYTGKKQANHGLTWLNCQEIP